MKEHLLPLLARLKSDEVMRLWERGRVYGHLLREHPWAGVSVVAVALTLLAILRPLFNQLGESGHTDFGFLLALTKTIIVGWLFGRKAAFVTLLLCVTLLLAFPLNPGPASQAVGILLLVLSAGLFLYVLGREQNQREEAERQAAQLTQERDALERARVETARARHQSEEVAREQRQVLATLQKETLNADGPRIRHLSFDLAYVPAGTQPLIGGDFYNIFRLSDTRAAVILGDIAGKGAQAAAAGLVVSSMLRAFFTETRSPAEALRRLNTVLTTDGDFRTMATLFAAIVDGATCSVVYANAGQERPCILSPWGNVTILETTAMTLGSLPDDEIEERTLAVPPGHTLVAFTDGLTEVRQPDGSWMDPGLIYTRLAELGGYPPDQITREMLAWAKERSGGDLRDDAALLAITFEEKVSPFSPERSPDDRRGQVELGNPE